MYDTTVVDDVDDGIWGIPSGDREGGGAHPFQVLNPSESLHKTEEKSTDDEGGVDQGDQEGVARRFWTKKQKFWFQIF